MVATKQNSIIDESKIISKESKHTGNPCDPGIPLQDMYSQEIKSICQSRICIIMFITVLFIIVKKWKQIKCLPTARCRKCVIHMQKNTM